MLKFIRPMHPMRPISALWSRCLFLCSFSAFQLVSFSQDAPAPADLSAAPTAADAAYQRFRSGTLDLRTLAEVLPQMANPERRAIIRSTLLEAKSPPRTDLVALLQYPALAARLGSLELLEELAGGDLSYNPWLPADAPENLAAFARWKAWAGEPAAARPNARLYSQEQRRSYLRDILGEDADKASRARRMLEAEGLAALGFLESFLAESPTLTASGRSKIRAAQYQITLTRPLGDQAAVTARHLAFGNRDQMLSALATTRTAGWLALPILRDFISHPDSLVRETAIDALLITGADQAVPVVAPLLATEPDVNVIHGALRRLKDIPGPATEKLVASFLSHPDEDLLVSAIQTCLTLGGNNRPFSSSGSRKSSTETSDVILRTLTDPRWRVRAAALEYVAKTKLTQAKDPCLALLDDPDEFVRFAAIKAIGTLGAKEALPKLKALFLANEAMAGPVIEGYGALKTQPDAELLDRLDAGSPDAKLAAIRAVESSESLAPIALRYAADANMDVACAALRLIASPDEWGKTKDARDAIAAIVTALRSGSPEKIAAILERLLLPASGMTDPAVLAAIDTATLSAVSATRQRCCASALICRRACGARSRITRVPGSWARSAPAWP
jgi:HEAT repeat protein